MFDVLSLYIALTPLAVYLMLLGIVNMSRRPFVVSGTRDLAVVLVALSGFVAVGPMQLFFPVGSEWALGVYVWFYMAILYGLFAFLFLLHQRLRLNIYNMTLLDLRPILSDVAMELDETARWAGDALALPKLGILLYLDANEKMENVSLISCGKKQAPESWAKLRDALTQKLSTVSIEGKRPVGTAFFVAGLLAFILLHGMVWFDSAEILHALPEFLRI